MLENSKIIVFGGAGFVGSAVVMELLEMGAEVLVFDNLIHGVRNNIPSSAKFFFGDVLDAWKIMECFEQFEPDYIINLIGETYIPTAYHTPKRFIDTNVIGIYNILTASKKVKVKKILHISTAEVYGCKDIPLNEEVELSFVNTYAVTKIAGDGLCYTFSVEHNVPVVVARLFNCYGPRSTEPYVISDIIKQLKEGPVVRLGNISTVRDFTYVHDSALALIGILQSEIKPGEVVNVGSGRTYTIEWIFNQIASLMGVEAQVITDSGRFRKKDILYLCCDNKKLVSLTGWTPKVSILDGLKKTIDWFSNSGSWSWEEYVDGSTTLK